MANPGYGKRTAPGQRARAERDFTHLHPRDAAIAAYVDRLPDGADISVKTLAKALPYGQCALSTSLNRMQKAGHLRRGREKVTAESGSEVWVTRTWFSRIARDDVWWGAFTRGDVPGEDVPAPTRSRAVILLAALGRTHASLSLSGAECERLAPLVEEWFARGVGDETVRTALTAGLPSPVHSPSRLLERRLVDKLPPPPVAPVPVRRLLECSECGVPGTAEALPGGVCGACGGAPARPAASPCAPEIRVRAEAIRQAMALRKASVYELRP
ncbi:hypothetical protein ABZX85_45780 [Streptomyces sp. NPDC004539]|uniref:hypothetical protein n=1 Tax=Streptomyces sp. NPDC004539 TaxID=3154280 RepID=UPI0033B8B206